LFSGAQITSTRNITVTFNSRQCFITTISPINHHYRTFPIQKDGNLFFLGVRIVSIIQSNAATTKPKVDTLT